MKKFFRGIAYIFLTLVFASSLGLFLWQGKVLEYLNLSAGLTNENAKDRISKLEIKGDAKDSAISPDALFQDPKFIKLQKAVIDTTGLNLPRPQTAGTSTTETPEEKLPDFKVGNDNPFKSF